jgi:hypothetical protein
VAPADLNGDGRPEILVTNLVNEGSTLFENNGEKGFFDVSLRHGLPRPTMTGTGFGTGWLDCDNDGRLDLFIANGSVTIVESQAGSPYPYAQKNLLLHNTADPARLIDITDSAGPGLATLDVSRGAAFGDVDNDGDTDVLVTNNNGLVRLLINDSTPRRHWLQVRLRDSRGDPFATGARLELRRDSGKTYWRTVQPASSYLSASDYRVHFGLGGDPSPGTLVVHWPDGTTQQLPVSSGDRLVAVERWK